MADVIEMRPGVRKNASTPEEMVAIYNQLLAATARANWREGYLQGQHETLPFIAVAAAIAFIIGWSIG
jgi:hypothetical protein